MPAKHVARAIRSEERPSKLAASPRLRPKLAPRPVESTAAEVTGIVSRGEAARMMGVSLTSLRRLEGNALHPKIEQTPKGLRHVFDAEEVLTVSRKRRVHASPRADGATSAEVFRMLDAQTHPVEIVKELELEPAIVESLLATWARLRGLLLLSTTSRETLRKMLRSDPAQAFSELELVDQVRELVEADVRKCLVEECGGEAELCESCSRERAQAMLERGHGGISTLPTTGGRKFTHEYKVPVRERFR